MALCYWFSGWGPYAGSPTAQWAYLYFVLAWQGSGSGGHLHHLTLAGVRWPKRVPQQSFPYLSFLFCSVVLCYSFILSGYLGSQLPILLCLVLVSVLTCQHSGASLGMRLSFEHLVASSWA